MNIGHESFQQIDSGSGAFNSISWEHHKIHAGESYERHIDSANAVVAAMNAAFKTGNDVERAHMLFGWASNDEILFEIVEGATWSQGSGTALTIFNNNRESSNVSGVLLEDKNQVTFTASNQVIKDVTGISGGIVIENQYTYNASTGQNRVAESRAAVHEWLLKPNTTYIVRMTKTDANCKMSIDLHWYEHKPLNVYPDDITFVRRW